MLDVKKDDREVSNLMLARLSSEYRNLPETLVVLCPKDPAVIETRVREKFPDLQTENSSKQHGGVALAARVEKKAGK